MKKAAQLPFVWFQSRGYCALTLVDRLSNTVTLSDSLGLRIMVKVHPRIENVHTLSNTD